MKNTQTLSYQDLVSMAQDVSTVAPDCIHFKSQHKAWGSFENKTLRNKFFGIHELKADLTDNFRVAFDEEQMPHNMNICLAVDGKISLNLKESNFVASLSPLKYHGIYSHETAYDLVIDKSIHVLHITIDREYYANLLHEDEKPAAVMREKLLNKDRVWSGTGNVNVSMKRAVDDILHNPLNGNLKTLFTEAKILELVALQLNDFNQSHRPLKNGVKDNDVFHALRAYLDMHFRDELSLRSLSRMFGVNEFKLKKGFKSLFNATVFDYIHELKMMHARTLLLDEKMFVNEVAGIVGYKNANHFSTAFKRKFGVSPKVLK